jgi:glycerol dehydrogenase-like iron-containing ADH family enzyme
VRMRCMECDAFLYEYRAATERYAVLSEMLEKTGIPKAFPDLEFQKLKDQVAEARLHCHRVRKALTIHRESRLCPRSKLPQHHRDRTLMR